MISRPDRESADWLARLQRDDVTDADRAELERWLDADPSHAVAFARTEFAWERAERLRALPSNSRSAASPRSPSSLWRAAAAFVIFTVGAAFWYYTTQWNSFSTELGERRTVALADGSQVNLNTASRLEIDYDKDMRAVRLVQGEALFKVTYDPRRPFVVRAGDTVVRAVGTAFNVRMENDVVEVIVTEGAVAVDGENRVVAGAAAVAAAGTVKRVALTEDVVKRRVAWREGVIELNGETLDQAVEEFNRYQKSKLVVADPAIASLRVGGRFETDEAAKFVNALAENFSIRAVQGADGSTYLLGPDSAIEPQ